MNKIDVEMFVSDVVAKANGRKVFLLVSGGVDSTVVFALLNRALGQDRVLGLHIDTGLMRLGESQDVIDYMKGNGFENLHVHDAADDFLAALDGVFEPEIKREVIGNKFLDVKTVAQERLGLNSDDWIIAQGTIYPDVIETAGEKGGGKIKTHHNRVDLILELIEKGLVIEPLASLYKDEVRELGEKLGIPRELIYRHPFPGPGLGVRCLCSPRKGEKSENLGKDISLLPVRTTGVKNGERTYSRPIAFFGDNLPNFSENYNNRVVLPLFCEKNDRAYKSIVAYCTKKRLEKLRAIDKIANDAIVSSGEYEKIWQMPVVLLPLVNSNGNETVVLRPVVSKQATTAKACKLKQSTVRKIIKESRNVEGIGDIFIDVTNKPPATIEWE